MYAVAPAARPVTLTCQPSVAALAGAVTIWLRRVHAGVSGTVVGVAAIGWPAASNQRGTTPNWAPAASERPETASVSCSPESTGIRLASLNTRGAAAVAVTFSARAPSAEEVGSAAIVASAACVPAGVRRSNELLGIRLATGASLPWSVTSSSRPACRRGTTGASRPRAA